MRTGSSHIATLAGAVLAAAVLGLAGVSAANAKVPARDAARQPSVVDGSATFVPGEVVVRFRAGASEAARQAALAAQGAKVAKRLAVRDAVLAKLPPGRGVWATVTALEQRAAVRYAEPNLIRRPLAAPNDPRYASGDLWALNQPSDADIDAPAAWDTTTGSANVVVAVVDTGVAWNHPDLAPNIWSNPGEVLDGVDNDGNGKVDDVRGWDFVGSGMKGDNDPADQEGHGTHVAGTIGAQGNNALGVVGMNWDVSVMPVRVLGPGGGTSADLAAGFAYAAEEGARVVNASLGCQGADCFAQIEKDAIDGASDTLFVFAAGNYWTNTDLTPTYPCSYASDNIVCVAATTRTDGLANFSNYGTTAVDLGAPGVGITSTWLAGTYATIDGTSMATPHVSGVAALAWAKNPGATVALVKSALLNGGDAMSSLSGKVATGRRLNAAGTLALVPPRITTPALSCNATAASAGAPTIRGNGSAFEYVFWRTIFWRFDGTTWQPSAAPWLWSYATAAVPTSEWRLLDSGSLLGTTGSVMQSQTTSPPGGYWAATAEVYWLSQALQFADHDHVPVRTVAGSNAVAGTSICAWPGAQALHVTPSASDLRALRAPVAGVPSALARRAGRVLTG